MRFSDICTFAVLYAAYLAARRGKRSRAATAHYEAHLLERIINLVYILRTKIYIGRAVSVCSTFSSPRKGWCRPRRLWTKWSSTP